MKVIFRANYGFAGSNIEDEFEVEDDMTEDEIEEEAYQWAIERVDYSYEIIEE